MVVIGGSWISMLSMVSTFATTSTPHGGVGRFGGTQCGDADAVVGGPGGGFFANDSGERFVVEMPQWGV